MVILGINGVDEIFHDASASLIVDGQIVASVEEERFNRKKHTNGIPYEAVSYCLHKGGISPDEVDHIGYYLQPEVLHQTFLTDIVKKFGCDPCRLGYIDRAVKNIMGVESRLHDRFAFGPKTEFHFLNHHLAHAASAYYIAGFDHAAILTVDGSGDRESSALFHGCLGNIRKVHEFLVYPESLGFIYSVFADHLGLTWISGPGKLMGLAGYGCPDPHLFDDIIRLQENPIHPIAIDLSFFEYHLGGRGLSPKGLDRFGDPVPAGGNLGQRHFVLAASMQKATELAVLHLAKQIHHFLPDERNLCFSGGVALNVTTNRRIRDLGALEGFFVPPAANDGGTSLGCALYLDAKFAGRHAHSFNVYTGPDIERDYEIEKALQAFGNLIVWERLPESELINRAADALVQRRFVGWIQGRMECGPRALGNRSILANPMPTETKDRLNNGIKKREAFRPYAPSVLREECSHWFDLEESPYMLLEAKVHDGKRDRIPAVVHVDGTSRPQTVAESSNPRFYKLIRQFHERTGVPLILNTSFNQHGEPIANRPEEAVAVLLATELDELFVGDYHVRRNSATTKDLEWVSVAGRGAWKNREIPGLFQLAEVVSHNDSKSLMEKGHVQIGTAAAQWSYAAAFPLNRVALASAGHLKAILIRVKLHVHRGRVGLLFVADDLKTIAGEPVEQVATINGTSVNILLDPVPNSGWLIVRNNEQGALSSKCSVNGIQTFSASLALPEKI
jgi:carbamoyltransferase